jgi:sulfatase maturation enzyme AslB (radical SAM superfamily)
MTEEITVLHTIVNRHNTSSKFSSDWRASRSDAYHEYRRLWHALPQHHEVSQFPLHLDLDIISTCNLRCIMCAQTILRAQGNLPSMGSMSIDFVKNLIEQGAPLGLASIKFNFQGEPLLHPELPAMVAYAKQRGISDTSINTNATLLTRDKSIELLEAGLDNIFFSIDSNEKKNFETIRVGANFDEVVDNIRQFLDLKQQLGKNHLQTGVNMVVLDINRHEIQTMDAFWANLVDTFSCGIEQHSSVMQGSAPCRQPIPNFCCSQLWQRLFIIWDGTCVPCCMDSRHDLALGNAHDMSVASIWQSSQVYHNVRARHQSGNCRTIPLCNSCSFPYSDTSGQT